MPEEPSANPTEPQGVASPPPATPETPTPQVIGPSQGSAVPSGSISPPAPVVGSQLAGQKKPSKLPLFMIIIVAIIAVSLGVVFGYILPNQPENVWKTALKNSGAAVDKLIDYSETQKDVKGYKLAGDYKAEGSLEAAGTFAVQSYENEASLNFNLDYAGKKYAFDMLTTQNDDKKYDAYFRLGGIDSLISALGLSTYDTDGTLSTALKQLDNKWIVLSQEYLESFGVSSPESNTELTNEDVIAISRAFNEVNKEYLFSDQEDKRLLKINKSLGKEDRDGRSTYHYEIVIDGNNTIAYLEALKERLASTKLKEVMGDAYETLFTQSIEDAKRSIKEDSEPFEVWVDAKTKLIRYIRIADKDKPDNFTEIGMPYDGGDKYPFTISGGSKDNGTTASGTFKFELDTTTHVSTMDLDIKSEGTESFTFTANAKAENSNEPLALQKPKDALTFEEAMLLLQEAYSNVLGTNSEEETTPVFPFMPPELF